MKETAVAKTAWPREKASRRLAPQTAKLNVSNLLVYTAGFVVIFIILCALIPAQIAPYSPTEMVMTDIMLPPSLTHFLEPIITVVMCLALLYTEVVIRS